MRFANGLVSGAFFVLAVVLLCHLQGAEPIATFVLVLIAFLTGVAAAQIVPGDADKQDRVGFTATVTLLFAILLWGIQSVFRPMFGFLGPIWATAASPLIPTVLLYLIARKLLDFGPEEWGLRPLPRREAGVVALTLALIATLGVGLLEGRLRFIPDVPVGVVLALVVLWEEILYRGFLLAALRERVGTPGAVAVQAIVFTLAGALAEPALVPIATRLVVGVVTGAAVAGTGWVPGAWLLRTAGILLLQL